MSAALVVWELPLASNQVMSVRFTHAAPFLTVPAGRGVALLTRSFEVRIFGEEPVHIGVAWRQRGLQNRE